MPRKTPGLGHHTRIKKAMEDFILSIHVGKKFRNLDVQQFMLKETGDSAGYSFILKTLSEDPRVVRDGQRGWRRVDGPAKQTPPIVEVLGELAAVREMLNSAINRLDFYRAVITAPIGGKQ